MERPALKSSLNRKPWSILSVDVPFARAWLAGSERRGDERERAGVRVVDLVFRGVSG